MLSRSSMMIPNSSRRFALGVGMLAASGGIVAARNFNWWPFGNSNFDAPNLQPPETGTTGNRIFLPVRYKEELHPMLLQHRPILLNFTIRGHKQCNKLTGALQRIVSLETDKLINLVDIELDEPGNQDLLLEYRVSDLPSVVLLNKQLIVGRYTALAEAGLMSKEDLEVDWQGLKAWIESVAEEPPKKETK